tara:strand:- start:232 stop:405 length:174 start_codon:yes stop_codon:yes gene_type:complete
VLHPVTFEALLGGVAFAFAVLVFAFLAAFAAIGTALGFGRATTGSEKPHGKNSKNRE